MARTSKSGYKFPWPDDTRKKILELQQTMTNVQMADYFGCSITLFRYKKAELGIKAIEMEYWTAEMVQELKCLYKTTGDVEIAIHFQSKFPKNKKWIKQHICKKRKYLKLVRTKKQIAAIMSKNSSEGGRSYTVNENSSSKNMHASWVVQRIAWRDKKIQDLILKDYPELIDLKRQQLTLNKQIKANEQTR